LNNSIPSKINDDITCTVEGFNRVAQQATWSATPISSNAEINIEYSPTIKEKSKQKKVSQVMAD